jgi:glycerol-3-phosphate dehydrogenase
VTVPAAPDASYDLVIIGGGIVGAGIARDAALRGLSVAIVDKADWGAGTSSKSSKLVHGGLRYLEHGEIRLVFESVSERRVQTRVAPHLVRPLEFVLPIYKDNKPGLEVMNIGLWIYDSLALFRSPGLHRTLRGRGAALLVEPQLRGDGLRGVIEYYDCATDDARLVLENVLDAEALGATCHTYTAAEALVRDTSGRVVGVTVRDRLDGGAARTLGCRLAVLAAGAWTDELIGDLAVPVGRQLLRRTKGVHIVVPHERLPVRRAVTLISGVDGRVFFAIPWRERTVVGTTDTDFVGTADDVHADRADVDYLCRSINGYFPAAKLSADDVIATWAGLRPLIRGGDGEDESEVSREHEIFVRPEGVLVIAGGKLTTYRRMAKEAVDKGVAWLVDHDDRARFEAVPRCSTKHRPLPGARELPGDGLEAVMARAGALTQQHGLPTATAEHLAGVYGVRAGAIAELSRAEPHLRERLATDLPYVWAEIDAAVRLDHARTLVDVLGRRVPLLLVDRDQGLGVCEQVATRLAGLLEWTDTRRAQELAAYRAEVAASRRFRA